jgi:hypothetical protein
MSKRHNVGGARSDVTSAGASMLETVRIEARAVVEAVTDVGPA